ncbi:xanthine dehydrogenase family protein molybdopterin-binding subunit [Dethiosulfatarculus sandiegensis]|uniref:4-hydroxybenzoyl-CoA reductase subunit alpha n=1 Tax=Dethiosulfatarculus sandiegensis TaxID=1429043 RepID=A0A0D2GBV4_9BACT|nr:xanthine dehydrogenase family protein molybdopterin-binding subunit [Dethiosulfatarculus sandiegensis]KIX12377.1 4-hydroxybenzoyl-CoA reductase subunit alpha [Dethiosulfatarculus sandiegensis]
MTELNYVGHEMPRTDARDKVTGRAVYINDQVRPGMLHGAILYAKHPHARIKNIDCSRAGKLPGVKAVITARDFPPINIGFLKDNSPLKKDKVRSLRDEVAAVAATDPETAARALELIEVEYEPLPGIFSPEDALAQNAPLLHETDAKGRPLESNKLRLKWRFESGDLEKAKSLSSHHASGEYNATWQSHCCLGLSGVIAEFDQQKNLTMHSITQIPYLAQADYANALKDLGLHNSRVRIKCQTIGGAFGSKLDTHCYEFIAILLAFSTGKPVKILFSREEEFQALAPRQPAIMKISQGCDENGRLTYREVKMLLDNGAYTSWGATTPSVMISPISSLYQVENISFTAECVYTNNIYCQAFRGYGNPQATFCVESNLDQLAHEIGMDPLEFRLLNANRPDTTTPAQYRITSCGLSECLKKVAQGLGWEEHQKQKASNPADSKKLKGMGLASMIHVGGGARVYRSDGHGMMMKLDDFGKLSVFTGAVEIGQGNETVLRQITAEALGVKMEDVVLVTHDTDLCPWDVGTHASRQAFISGNAAIKCASKLKRKILGLAADLIECRPEELRLQKSMIYHVSTGPLGQGAMPLAKILKKAHFKSQGQMLMAETFYDPPNEMLDREMKGNISCAWAFGAHGVLVEVDTETGQVEVLNYQAAHDVGRALNPLTLAGQVYGGSMQGLGYALSEELILKNGRVLNDRFSDYMLPTAKDLPPITPIIVETFDPQGPFGAKGVGEPGCVPSAPAIANAVFDAVGIRMSRLPMTPERVLKALRQKNKEDK